MVFFLAFRNITRNKKNSFIIALLIAVITFLFFIGNSVTGNVNRSLRLAYIESLTGDIVIQRAGDITMNLFGANTPIIDGFFDIPVLPAFEAVMEILADRPGVGGITSQVSGKAVLDMMGVREGVLLSGIDAATYFDLFPGIVLEEGRFLRDGEQGAMITLERARRIEAWTGKFPAIGTPMLLTAGREMSVRIREVPLVGIFRYQNPGRFMNEIVIIDPQTVRALNAIQLAGSVDVGEDATLLLGLDFDDIFGAPEIGGGETSGSTADEKFSAEFLLQAFLENPVPPAGDETGGDWNFIIVRLARGNSAAVIASLNRALAPYGVMAVNWRVAAGGSAIMMLLIQALYNAGIFLVSIAGIITVINILLIAVFRRAREIGTLRAIGASDGYIRSLILFENIIVALFAGAVGVAGGVLFLRWVNGMDFHIDNNLVVSLLGGQVLRIEFFPSLAVFSFFIAAALAFVASLYPVQAALKIEPIAAVRRG
ncbi:MAG: FtsX-like permease family protein [Treponema sp.]|nr:FtsX-like permease family protein [Treponema sp.]